MSLDMGHGASRAYDHNFFFKIMDTIFKFVTD